MFYASAQEVKIKSPFSHKYNSAHAAFSCAKLEFMSGNQGL